MLDGVEQMVERRTGQGVLRRIGEALAPRRKCGGLRIAHGGREVAHAPLQAGPTVRILRVAAAQVAVGRELPSIVQQEQQFFKHKLNPPADVIETASFLAISIFVQQRGAAAFVARSVGKHFEQQGTFKVLNLPVRVDLPPVGLITARGRPSTPVTEQLMRCLRSQAASA